jgi:hypothetical protein
MLRTDRREFLADVGQGMLAVLVGPALAGLQGPVWAAEAKDADPRSLEGLVNLMLETPTTRLLPALKAQMDQGVSLRTLVAAGAVANVRAFAGQYYEGYHAFMALSPAFAMAQELPQREQALPIFKVLYRNSTYIQDQGKPGRLGEAKVTELPGGEQAAQRLLLAAREHRLAEADSLVVAMSRQPLEQTYEELQPLVHDELNVHRVVLAWRSWEILDFTGKEHAQEMLRQIVRHCADSRNHSVGPTSETIRLVLPRLMEQYKLLGRQPGTRQADDAWMGQMAQTIYGSPSAKAAEAVAAALAEGFSLDTVGEAMSLAGSLLVLCHRGKKNHGASIGVHASDAANAWRHIAGAVSARHAFASLIAGAFHTAGQSANMAAAYPLPEDLDKVRSQDAATLLGELEEAIRGNDQRRACAVTQRYGQGKHAPGEILALFRKYAISEDGDLHAEKYYRTTSEEFARTRPAFRWQHLTALARVTASAYGTRAPGMAEARRLLQA